MNKTVKVIMNILLVIAGLVFLVSLIGMISSFGYANRETENPAETQKSVFECEVDPAQWSILKNELVKIIDESQDSLRIYYLGSNWDRKIEHIGAHAPPDMHDLLVV